mgnify:CR=1 FL=1
MTLRVMAGRMQESGVAMPTEVVLPLDEEEKSGCTGCRFQSRTVRSTDAGQFTVHYQTGVREDGARQSPGALAAIVPRGSAFAYDVVERVVRLRYLDLRQREEIRAALAANGVRICTGSVSNLSRQGLAGLEQLHMARAGTLAEHYRRKAFILHMDGTREGGDWTHFVMREGLTGHVLLCRKIRSEHSSDIEAMLEDARTWFGTPDCIVSDMSPAICLAVGAVFQDIPHRLCHYHFLKAVGKAMLGEDHDGLGQAVRRTTKALRGIRRQLTALLRDGHGLARPVVDLIDHIVSGTAELKAEGFPFDLPHLHYYRRCERIAHLLQRALWDSVRINGCADPVVGCMRDLSEQVRRLTTYLPYNPVKRLERRQREFERLRDILRPQTVDPDGKKAPLNWGMIPEGNPRPVDIAGPLRTFRDRAARMAKRKSLGPSERKMWKGIHRRMESYADRLDPIISIRGNDILLPRTNNLSETGFRDFKRRQRRTTGNGSLSRQLDHTPAQAFYAENLNCAEYTRIVFRNRTMAEALADVKRSAVMEAVEAMRMPPAPGIIDHSFINSPDFHKAIQARFARITGADAP